MAAKNKKICHSCRSHHWYDYQPVVWIDAEGKGYCLFHAPPERKKKARGDKTIMDKWAFLTHVRHRIDAVRATQDAGKEAICNLRGTIFPDGMNFLSNPDMTYPALDFRGAVFTGAVIFREAMFSSDVTFAEATFVGPADFVYCKGKQGALDMGLLTPQSIGNLMFTKASIPLFTFRTATWPERLGLETYLGTAYISTSHTTCEELYRAMKLRAASEHDQPMVSRWHYREKLMGLKRIVVGDRDENMDALTLLELVENTGYCVCFRAFQWLRLAFLSPMRWWRTLLWWYWSCSGFGERPKRACGVLLTLILPLFGIFIFADLRPMDQNSFWSRILGALQHLLFVTNPTSAPKEPFWATLVVLLTRVAIPVQFGLFALAVRNRFRR